MHRRPSWGHPVIVCVECRDHKRPSDVSWVDAMKTKHDRLPTNALILVSRSGFTQEARAVAEGFGIQAFALSEVDEVDFQTLLSSKSSLWTKTMTVTPERVLVRVPQTATLPAEVVASSAGHLGSLLGRTRISNARAHRTTDRSPKAYQSLLSEGKEDHKSFEMCREPPRAPIPTSAST